MTKPFSLKQLRSRHSSLLDKADRGPKEWVRRSTVRRFIEKPSPRYQQPRDTCISFDISASVTYTAP